MIKVLITGSNGFIGNNIMAELKGKVEIFTLDRTASKLKNSYVADITDFEKTAEIYNEIKPDVLIHLAAIVHKNNVDTSEENYNLVNYESSVNLFNLAKEHGTKKIIFTSTIEVYGENDYQEITENTDVNPTSFYAKSKFKCEEYLEDNFKNSGIEYAILRLTPVYGPNFTLNVDKRVYLKKDKVAYYFKNGDYSFDFLSVLNLNKFINFLILKDYSSNVFLLSDQESISVKNVIKTHKLNNKILALKLSYHSANFTIGILEKVMSIKGNKDVYLSKRNFNKLFQSKAYKSVNLPKLDINLINTYVSTGNGAN